MTGRVPSAAHPANAGCLPARRRPAGLRVPRPRPSGPAASPQALRAPTGTRPGRAPPGPCLACRLSLSHSFSPSARRRRVWNAGSRVLGCAGPGDRATDPRATQASGTGLTQAARASDPGPWPLAALPRRPAPRPSALAAPPHQPECPTRFRVLCLVCVPLFVPTIPFSARVACLPNHA